MTRFIEMQIGGDIIGPTHVTEYLVKADTRELEHHIQQQFPMAKVTITSLGANSLMLNGTTASDEDSHGIVELAEQFAPKVLNRLKVGAAGNGVSRETGWHDLQDAKRTRTPSENAEAASIEINSSGGGMLRSAACRRNRSRPRPSLARHPKPQTRRPG